MNQSINTDSKNSKEPQQKYRLGTVSIKILGGLNRFYRRLTKPLTNISGPMHEVQQNVSVVGYSDKVMAKVSINCFVCGANGFDVSETKQL